jgi:hypothetical protein
MTTIGAAGKSVEIRPGRSLVALQSRISAPMEHCRRGADQGFLRSNQGNKWLAIVYERSLKVVCNFYSSKRDLQNQID